MSTVQKVPVLPMPALQDHAHLAVSGAGWGAGGVLVLAGHGAGAAGVRPSRDRHAMAAASQLRT
jgi:hypothetical protein